ncbi:hypothetical protein R3P38DRAFT_3200436 [Favolaschia claudopus]|uniref:Secreted protein n=1 Tax=Favolaschia claudopus TaxID=2862362 RepID=A0AAW0B3Q1_9AGAR
MSRVWEIHMVLSWVFGEEIAVLGMVTFGLRRSTDDDASFCPCTKPTCKALDHEHNHSIRFRRLPPSVPHAPFAPLLPYAPQHVLAYSGASLTSKFWLEAVVSHLAPPGSPSSCLVNLVNVAHVLLVLAVVTIFRLLAPPALHLRSGIRALCLSRALQKYNVCSTTFQHTALSSTVGSATVPSLSTHTVRSAFRHLSVDPAHLRSRGLKR